MAIRPWLGVHIKSDGLINASGALLLAAEAERLGYSGVTLNEDVGHDAFATLGAMAMSTKTIALGTAIINVYTRSALQIAMGAATIDDLSGGRAMLGLSVGHHPWNDRYHGIPIEPPLPRLREYVLFIKKALSGRHFRFDGEIFRGVEAELGFTPFREDLPVYIGGDRRGMLELSAKIADGSIMNVVPARYVADFAAEHYFQSARTAGRDVDALELTAIVTCCVNADRAHAFEDARRAFVSRLRTNPAKMIDLRPREHQRELAPIIALIDAGRIDEAEEAIPFEIVTDTIAAGEPQEVIAAIDRFYAAGCTRVLIAPYPRTPESVRDALGALAPQTH